MIRTVTDINNNIRNILHNGLSGTLKVTGEVSNSKLSGNNIFFTLKDEGASLGCVVWNYKGKLDIMIENGNKIVVSGRIDFFRNGGSVQINVGNIEIIGSGDLFKSYVALKEKFDRQGYFNNDIKVQLPKYINNIGIVTAKDGAALKDLLYVLEKSHYKGNVFIKNAFVQGRQCPQSISTCTQELDDMDLDIIIIARGGGSYEDLFGFSSELVVETIRNASTCIISAIGHEIDFMLSDFVADIRAPTPSIAGEIICSHQKQTNNVTDISDIKNKLYGQINQKLNKLEISLYEMNARLTSPKQCIDNCYNKIDKIYNMCNVLVNNKLTHIEKIFNNLEGRLNQANPQWIFDKGYCIIADKDGKIITSKRDARNKKKLKLIFQDGYTTINIK